jgi:hypothetical protein
MPISLMRLYLLMATAAAVHHRVRSTEAQITIIVFPFDLASTLVHWFIMICSQVTYTHIQPFLF